MILGIVSKLAMSLWLVGAGVSVGYGARKALGLPTWLALLIHVLMAVSIISAIWR